jgi:3-keto-5-aminohexanoate cleavage enzyme
VPNPLILEVALNGVTRKDHNPAVPESPEEIAADALACLDAGAAIVHTHCVRGNATSADAAEQYAVAYRLVLAERPDAILYPTMGAGRTIDERYGHHDLLAEEGLIRQGLVDTGAVLLGGCGPDGVPVASDYAYVNTTRDIAHKVAVCQRYGLGPNIACFEPGFLRTALAYHVAGALPAGAMVKLYFSGERGYLGGAAPIFSPPPIPEAFALYRAMLGDAADELAWSTAVLGGDVLATPIADLALAAGGHLRVGLEDDPTAPSNVDAVRRAAARAEEHGRPLATPDDAALLMGLPPRERAA